MKQSCSDRFKVTPRTAIKFTKLTVFLTCIWPPMKNSNNNICAILFEIFWCLSVFLSVSLVISLIFSINKFSDNTFTVMKSGLLVGGITNFISKTIIVRIHRERLQEINLELHEFLKIANDEEMAVLQKYVDKCWKFHGCMACSFYLATIGVITGPLFLPQKFPCDAVYPFPVDSPIISTLVYLHHCIVGFQCSAALALDSQAALFLWYICARFELFFKQIENIKNFRDFRSCIKTHQNILSSARKLVQPVRFIFLTEICMTKIGIVSGAIVLISNQPMAAKIQFIIIVISLTVSIFVCVWPAEKLINVSGNLTMLNIFYASSTHPPAIRKMWLNVLRRAQTPVTIKIDGFMDALSYEYYSAFLSALFSYITALRVIFKT